jgi:ABC-2 type transport system permease protein
MLRYLVQKELREQIFSLKGVILLTIVALMFSGLSYSFIGIKEVSSFSQASVIGTFMKVVLGFGMLMSIIVAASSIASEKEQGTLESLMLVPMHQRTLVAGKWIGAMAIWIVISIMAIPYLLVLGYGTGLYGTMLLYLFGFATLATGAFTAVATGLSMLVQSSRNAVMLTIALFLIVALPLFMGTTFKKTGFGSIIDHSSPLSTVINLTKELFLNKWTWGQAMLGSLSLFVFAVLAFLFLRYAMKKLSLLGGE